MSDKKRIDITRREFMRLAGLAGGAAFLGSCVPVQPAAPAAQPGAALARSSWPSELRSPAQATDLPSSEPLGPVMSPSADDRDTVELSGPRWTPSAP